MIGLILVDFADSAVKGWDNVLDLGVGYLSLRGFLLLGAVVAMRPSRGVSSCSTPRSVSCGPSLLLVESSRTERGVTSGSLTRNCCSPRRLVGNVT